MRQLLWCCGLLFVAAIIGSVYCGALLGNEDLGIERAQYLRKLIYFHFILSQLSIVGASFLLYHTRYRARRSNLLVSYNEQGMGLLPPGIKLRAHTSYHCCLGKMGEAQLPDGKAPIIVYPMMMQSGYSSGERLENELRAEYAKRGMEPELYIQPVIGASPWLVTAAAGEIRKVYEAGMGVLVVAHESARGMEETPEPKLFCRRLRKELEGVRVELSYFGDKGEVMEALKGMREEIVVMVPFLLTEGVHFRRDLPTVGDAAGVGKRLVRLGVLGRLLG